MNKNYLSTASTGLMLSLAALILPPVSDLKADIFTKITAGPGGDIGNSRGPAWGDYDGDGFIDLFVPQVGPNGTGSAYQFLYHNNRNGTFSRVTTGPVAAVFCTCRAAAWGDHDNNGYPDLLLGNMYQQNNFFHSNGDGSFTDDPDPSFVSDSANCRGMTWVDYDSDGYLDFFRTAANDPIRLYHNNRDGTFPPDTQPEFLTAPGIFQGVAWGDYNSDGRPDLFLPQAVEGAGQSNILYRNDGGGTFTRVGNPFLDGTNSAHAAWGDYDNDGDLDLFVSCSAGSGDLSWPNLLYRNDGNDGFTSITSLPANDPEYFGGASHGCKWGDYDNDGWLDLFVANRTGQNDYLYHNNGDGTFTKVVGSIAVNDGANTFGAAWGDYDNDGFLDLFASNATGTNFLYHNNGNANHWLEFLLTGTRSNRGAVGAKVRVHATINGQSFWQMREVPGGDGSSGQNSPYVHVGLGNATNADIVRIEWPSGTVQELQNVASGQFHTVTEPGGEPQLTAARVNGQQQLTLTGKQGSRYDIQTSTDLTNWNSPLNFTVSLTNAGGTMTFPAPGSITDLLRFYRSALR